MEPLEIRKYPDKILRKQCNPIGKITEREKEFFGKMIFTMMHLCGIGLAAPQVGIAEQLIVADIGEGLIRLANPEIVKVKSIDKMAEGCLSILGYIADIERPYEIIVKGLNGKGKIVKIKAKGLLARVLQHEIDHLKGTLIIDYKNVSNKSET